MAKNEQETCVELGWKGETVKGGKGGVKQKSNRRETRKRSKRRVHDLKFSGCGITAGIIANYLHKPCLRLLSLSCLGESLGAMEHNVRAPASTEPGPAAQESVRIKEEHVCVVCMGLIIPPVVLPCQHRCVPLAATAWGVLGGGRRKKGGVGGSERCSSCPCFQSSWMWVWMKMLVNMFFFCFGGGSQTCLHLCMIA